MNKDVVYIEPDDDITDVINHIKSAKQKVVALVPPKKLGILRSAINIKLITKASKQYNKVVVLVTADPSVLKLAATAGIPIAKTLQSRPVIPKLPEKVEKKDNDVETIEGEEPEDEPDGASKPAAKTGNKSAAKSDKKEADLHLNSAEVEEETAKKSAKKSEKDKNNKKDGKKIPNFDKYRKFIIAGGVVVVALIVFLVWAFGFSGSADITVKIRTSVSSFAENVSFVTKEADINTAEGKLLLEKVEFSKESKVEFEPTGEKDFGNKASGKLSVSRSLKSRGDLSIPAGTKFFSEDLVYVASADVNISWDGLFDSCPSIVEVASRSFKCVLTASVDVMASEGGTKYNIPADQTWQSDVTGIYIANSEAFSGGTTDLAKVVTEDDITKAKAQLDSGSDGKSELLEKVDTEEVIAIDASYAAKTDDPKSSPAVGEKVSGKATLSAKTTYSMFVVSKNSVSEFVSAKIGPSLASDQKIYDSGSPFFERFLENDGAYSAKLKTTIKTGPEVSESTILEKSLGHKIGEVQTLLQSINGISSVKVETPYPWVWSVPNDASKVTISIEVEE